MKKKKVLSRRASTTTRLGLAHVVLDGLISKELNVVPYRCAMGPKRKRHNTMARNS